MNVRLLIRSPWAWWLAVTAFLDFLLLLKASVIDGDQMWIILYGSCMIVQLGVLRVHSLSLTQKEDERQREIDAEAMRYDVIPLTAIDRETGGVL